MTSSQTHSSDSVNAAAQSLQQHIASGSSLTQSLCLECVRRNGLDLEYVPPTMRSMPVLLAAVKQNATCIRFFDNDDWYGVDRSPESNSQEGSEPFALELAMMAVSQSGDLLQHIPQPLRTGAVIRAALEQDGWALQHLNADQLNHDLRLAAVQQSGYALRFIASSDRTPELCLAAVLNAFPACILLDLVEYTQPGSERLQSLIAANWEEFERILGVTKAQEIRQAITATGAMSTADVQPSEWMHLPRLTLNDLGVLPGMPLLLRSLTGDTGSREVQFIGSMLGRGLFIDPLLHEGQPALAHNATFIVQGFTGQYSFSFLAKVVHALDKPFACSILEYPLRVDSVRVRSTLRVKSDWPACLMRPHLKFKNTFVEVPLRLHDLSLKGARVVSDAYVGYIGQKILLKINATVGDDLVQTTLEAEVRHVSQKNNDPRFYTGVQFGETTLEQKMVINYLMSVQAA